MESPNRYWQPSLQYAVLSDRGLRRSNNQDSVAAVPAANRSHWRRRGHLFLVADGMGAHAAGEMASGMTAELVPLTYGKLQDLSPPDALATAIRETNHQIHTRGNANRDFQGMGTTVSTLLLLPEGAVIGHVGDSRIYRLRGDRLEQLTADHSLAWDVRMAGDQLNAFVAEKFPNGVPKNIITRSLGPAHDVLVDIEGPIPIQPGDTFLMCSDGLSGPVHDPELATILSLFPPDEAARILVDTANLRGGPDNITLIIIRVNDPMMRELGADGGSIVRFSAGPDDDPELDDGSDADDAVGAVNNPPRPVVTRGQLHTFAAITAGAGLAAGLAAGVLIPSPWGIVGGIAATAVVSLIGVVIGMIWRDRLAAAANVPPWHATLRGHGPYMQQPVDYDVEFMQRLARITLQLREASENSGWEVDREPFRGHYESAVAASNIGDHRTAIRELCLAMRFLMEQLRSGRPETAMRKQEKKGS